MQNTEDRIFTINTKIIELFILEGNIDILVKLWRTNVQYKNFIEHRDNLNYLSKKFKVDNVKSFKSFVDAYYKSIIDTMSLYDGIIYTLDINQEYFDYALEKYVTLSSFNEFLCKKNYIKLDNVIDNKAYTLHILESFLSLVNEQFEINYHSSGVDEMRDTATKTPIDAKLIRKLNELITLFN